MASKEYHREWNRKQSPEWHAQRAQYRAQKRREQKNKAVEYKGHVCYDCKQTFPDCCFDFHHLDPLKDNTTPSQVLHCAWETVLKMLDECVMLCSNCHRIRHSEDGYIAHTKR